MTKKKAKMITLEQRAVASFHWDEHEEARIERNLFAHNGDTWEALRFCKNRDGRHNRVHLVIGEAQFVDLSATPSRKVSSIRQRLSE